MDSKTKQSQLVFERYLSKSRFIILPGVIITLLIGTLIILYAIGKFYEFAKEIFYLGHRDVIIESLIILDIVLIGIVFFIFSFSIHGIFVRKKDAGDDKSILDIIPQSFIIPDLDSLKNRLGRVVILLLILTFVKFSLNFELETMLDLLMFAASVLLLSLSLYFVNKHQ